MQWEKGLDMLCILQVLQQMNNNNNIRNAWGNILRIQRQVLIPSIVALTTKFLESNKQKSCNAMTPSSQLGNKALKSSNLSQIKAISED